MNKKIGPNDKCPCGSNKKYKKCYGVSDKNQNNCILFLKENVDNNIKHIQEFIDDATKEISNSILLLYKSKEQTLRSQMIILFAFIEAMAKMRSCFIYYKPLDGDKKMFVEWFDKFVCVAGNELRKDQQNLHLLDGSIFYELRCSLSHKLALPNLSFHGKNIIINSDSNSNHARALTNGIKGVIIFSPLEVSRMIFEATALMIDEINLKKNEDDYFKRIQNLANDLYKEGAVLIKMNDKK